MDELKERIFERLKHAVQLLASSPDVQLRLLPPFVCKADELALEFDHWLDVALHNYRTELTADQLCVLKTLDEKLTWLTTNAIEEWTEQAVRNSLHWENVRHLAAKMLQAFDWRLESPPSYTHEYVSPDAKNRNFEYEISRSSTYVSGYRTNQDFAAMTRLFAGAQI